MSNLEFLTSHLSIVNVETRAYENVKQSNQLEWLYYCIVFSKYGNIINQIRMQHDCSTQLDCLNSDQIQQSLYTQYYK